MNRPGVREPHLGGAELWPDGQRNGGPINPSNGDFASEGDFIALEPWQDLSHQISVDPPDHALIHISDLKDVVNARFTASTAAVDHLPYPPIAILLLAG